MKKEFRDSTVVPSRCRQSIHPSPRSKIAERSAKPSGPPARALKHGKPGWRPGRLQPLVGPSLPPCGQTGQALRDDLPCLVDQLANDLAGRLDLPDQANALAR